MNLNLIPQSWLTCSIVLALAACGEAEDPGLGTNASALVSAPSAFTAPPAGVLQQHDLATAGDVAIELANGDSMLLVDAASRSLKKHRALSNELKNAVDALKGDLRESELFSETPDAIILEAKTTFVVEDPAQLRSLVPALASYQAGDHGSQAFVLSEFSAAQRRKFDAFHLAMLDKPDDHPLGDAARQSPEQLLAAVIAGEGDISVTTTVRLPTRGLSRVGDQLMVPALKNGSFDFDELRPTATDHVSAVSQLDSFQLPPPSPLESGDDKTIGQYVNGFVEDNAFEWTERWDFPSGYFKVSAGAYYAFGLRIPIKVTGTMTPTKIVQGPQHDRDADSVFETEIEVKVFDAGPNFYSNAGLPDAELYEGKELVIEAGAYVDVRLSAGWGLIEINETIPKNPGFDFGEHFDPPFGDCGTDCGFDVWVPSEVTHTGINILGIVKGQAQVGFNVSGTGEAELTHESLYDGRVVPSSRNGNAEKSSHRLSFGSAGTRTFATELEALTEPGSKSFGYRISDVDYTWGVELTPGVKGDVGVNASPFFELDFDIGPLWLDFAKIDLGDLKLGTLDGTRRSHEVSNGEKKWMSLTSTTNDSASIQEPRVSLH